MEQAQIIVTIVVAVVAAAPGLVSLIIQRRKAQAETADVLIDTAMSFVEPLRVELKSLRAEIDMLKSDNIALTIRVRHLENENGDLREWADRLVNQVRSMRGEPVKMRGEA